jgi:histidine ammonia-lyase
LLSDPVSTRFGVHEEGNQDVTSHAMTSGLLGLENLRVLRYSLAQNLLAAAQAIDLRGGPDKLSPRTRPLYDFIRQQTGKVMEEQPLGPDIERLYEAIRDGAIMKPLRNGVFKDYQGPAQPTSSEGDNKHHSFPKYTSKL